MQRLYNYDVDTDGQKYRVFPGPENCGDTVTTIELDLEHTNICVDEYLTHNPNAQRLQTQLHQAVALARKRATEGDQRVEERKWLWPRQIQHINNHTLLSCCFAASTELTA